jgi:hypothetical protein
MRDEHGPGTAREGTPVLRETRWLAIAIIPFLAIAFVILYGFPTETARLFAWEIRPPMTAMMLGATYLGGVWFFARAAGTRTWESIAVGFPAVGAFATILGIATILHWDRFIHESLAFILWTILYWTTPFLVFGTWWRQQRVARDRPFAASVNLPEVVRWGFGIVGAAMVVVSAALFVAPAEVAASWPWPLSPLTARVMSAMFVLPGLVGLGVAVDGRWLATRIVTEAQIVAVGLIVVAPLIQGDGIDTESPMAWVFFGGLTALAVGLVILYLVMSRRERGASATVTHD